MRSPAGPMVSLTNGRSLPGRRSTVSDLAATPKEIAALDAYAEREKVSRSEEIRRALAAHAA